MVLARPEDVFGIVSPRVAGVSQELFFVIGVLHASFFPAGCDCLAGIASVDREVRLAVSGCGGLLACLFIATYRGKRG